MPNLLQYFNFGSKVYTYDKDLARQLSEAYTTTASAVNTKVSKYTTDGVKRPHSNPPANSAFNANWEIGDIYVRTDTDTAWILTSRTTLNAVTWTQIT